MMRYERTITVCALSMATMAVASGCGGAARSDKPKIATDRSVTVIGKGRTSLGEPFVAVVGMNAPLPKDLVPFAKELRPRGGCPLPVLIKEGSQGTYDEVCYTPAEVSTQAGVECSSGLLRIHLVALAATHSVRLMLGDGRRVTSSVMALPRQYGGPRALYYQTVRGPKPIPVSVTELGLRGEVLATVSAYRVTACGKEPVRILPGSRVLARAPAPGGGTITIASRRTEVLGATYFGLQLTLPNGTETGTAALRPAPPLRWEVSRICEPRPYGIVYGVLPTSEYEAFVVTGTRLQHLNNIRIPSSVVAHSTLVYGIVEGAPGRLIVRSSDGKTVVDDNIGTIFSEKQCVKT
jgi:hypothetical protein